MEHQIPQVAIYLDMDGVLADFDKKAKEIYPDFEKMNDFFHKGTGNKKDYNKMYALLLFRIMRTKNFWFNLEWMSDGKKLFYYVENHFNHDQVAVLTAPMEQDKRCRPEKWEWVQHHLKVIDKNRFFCSMDKEKFIGTIPAKHQILIDDRMKNITAWRQHGGIGIHHKDAITSIRELEGILKELKDIN